MPKWDSALDIRVILASVSPLFYGTGCEAAERRLLRFSVATNVYIDGFNLYYGALRGTAYKWLDLARLCSLLLPHDHINRIRYFTALVRPYAHDVAAPRRQQVYLRALATLPNVSIHLGHFLAHKCWMPLASSTRTPPESVEVIKTEEKGSDVNIATYLLWDAFRRDCDCSVLVSNDSDLQEPVRIVARKLGLRVGVINPHAQHASAVLVRYATFLKQIRTGVLAACQFPPSLADAKGVFQRPTSW